MIKDAAARNAITILCRVVIELIILLATARTFNLQTAGGFLETLGRLVKDINEDVEGSVP